MSRRASLLVVAILAAWGCKAGPGPPPLAAGADPAFERRLAELDTRYRFLFSDSYRIYEARMRGEEETVLLDLEQRKRSGGLTVLGWPERSPEVKISGALPLSPDGRWLLVPYFVADWPHQYDRQLLLLDVHSREVRLVPLPQDEGFELDGSHYAGELCHWLTAHRFVVSFSHYPNGGGIRKKFYDYDLADLSSPRAVTGFGDLEPLGGSVPNGPRDVVLHSYHNAEPLFDFEDARSHWDIRFGRRLLRRTWSPPSMPRWDEDLQLYTWWEHGEPGESYVMDADGRYQVWHAGKYLLEFPRP